MNKTDVKKIINQMNSDDIEVKPFVKLYLKKGDMLKFKQEIIKEYNSNVQLFKNNYESLKKDMKADWEFLGWPQNLKDNNVQEQEDGGLLIELEIYSLEIYGHDIPLPIEYTEITNTFEKIGGFDYEYEGILIELDDPVYGEYNTYVIGNKGRRDYSYTCNRLKNSV